MIGGFCLFKLDGVLMRVLSAITRFIHLQLIWILFTIIGLVIGGIFPATFAMFALTRKWIREHTDDPIFKIFKNFYKESFVKANFFGWFMTLLSFSIYFYFNWFSELTGGMSVVLNAFLLFLAIIFLIVALFLIPVYVHFDIDVLNVFKFSLTTALSYPLHTVAMIIILIVFWYLLMFLPIIFLFIGFSVLAFILMTIANAAFERIDRKLNKI